MFKVKSGKVYIGRSARRMRIKMTIYCSCRLNAIMIEFNPILKKLFLLNINYNLLLYSRL